MLFRARWLAKAISGKVLMAEECAGDQKVGFPLVMKELSFETKSDACEVVGRQSKVLSFQFPWHVLAVFETPLTGCNP